jgi:drug/metabolite transporter (DMT)-like permease
MSWFILAFISAVFSALSAVSEKKVLFSLKALDFSYVVSVVTLLFTIPFFFFIDYNIIYSTEMLVLFVKSLLGAAAFLCVMLAIKNLEISQALPLLALTPGIVAIAGVVFINDTLTNYEWLGIILMLTGAFVLEVKGEKKFQLSFSSPFSLIKYSYVFTALVLFTISSLLDRLLLKDYHFPPYSFMAFQQLFYALIFTAVVLYKRKSITTPVKGLNKNLVFLILLIAVFTVVYRYTQIEATKLVPVAMVLSVKRLSVLFAVVFGGRLFKEEFLFIRVTAVLLILIGSTVLLIS